MIAAILLGLLFGAFVAPILIIAWFRWVDILKEFFNG